MDPQYVPSEADVLQVPPRYEHVWNRTLQETRLSYGKMAMHVIGCSGDSQIQRSDWIPHFRDVTAIAFVVNLCSYDQPLPPSPNNIKLMKCLDLVNVIGTGRSLYTKLVESLYLFEALVNSNLHQNKPIFLFFTGIADFQKKLSQSPLSEHFSDYECGKSLDHAVQYILRLFQRINKAELRIHPLILPLENGVHFQLDPVLEVLSDGLNLPRRSQKASSDIQRISKLVTDERELVAKISSMAVSESPLYSAPALTLPARC